MITKQLRQGLQIQFIRSMNSSTTIVKPNKPLAFEHIALYMSLFAVLHIVGLP